MQKKRPHDYETTQPGKKTHIHSRI